MIIYNSKCSILILGKSVMIVVWQADLVNTKKVYFLIVNLITRTKDKYRKGGD